MKKLFVAAAAASLLGGSVFADISFGSWNRGVWATGNYTEKDDDSYKSYVGTTQGQSWGGEGPRTGLSVSANGANCGFALDFHSNGFSGIKQGDNAFVYASPFGGETLRVYFGKTDQSWLRGDACFGLWDMYRIGTVGSREGWTFMDVDASGTVFVSKPVQGLTLVAALNMPLDGSKKKAQDVIGLNGSKYAMGYDIEGVGTVKAGVETGTGFVYDEDGDKYAQNIMNFAFDLKAVDNLFFSVGAKVPTKMGKVYKVTKTEESWSKKETVEATADDVADGWVEADGSTVVTQGTFYGVMYKKNAASIDAKLATTPVEINTYTRFNATESLALHLRTGFKINAADNKKDASKKDGVKSVDDALGVMVDGGVTMGLADGLSAFVDLGCANGVYYSGNSSRFSDVFNFGFGVQKSLSNGWIAVAFEGATNNKGLFDVTKYGKTDPDKNLSWCVPVVINVGF